MANTPMHSVIGLSLVKILPWYIALPLSFLSHFLLDLYPEATGIDNKNGLQKQNMFFTITQFLLGIGIILFLIFNFTWLNLIAIILANLPDIWDAICVLTKRNKFWFCHHGNFPFKIEHWQEFCMQPWKNAVLDLIFVGTIILLLIRS